MSYIGSKPADKALTGADIEDGTVQIADLAATGTKDATTFLRGDGTFNGVANLSTASGSAPSYSARAWVNFDGTGTVAIRDSGNVTSITDNGTGDYTTNFTTAMPDDDYAVAFAATVRNNAASVGSPQVRSTTGGWTTGEGAMLTTSVRSLTRTSSGSDVDTDVLCVTVFR